MNENTSKILPVLFDQLIEVHPYLLRMLVWQKGTVLLDASHPDARLDRETNLLRIFAQTFLRFMPFMRIPLSDFRGELKNVRSVTKTITSLLAGMVFGTEISTRLEDPLRAYFPEIAADDPKAAIRIKHLLSNTAGLPSIEDFNSMRRLFRTKNWATSILNYQLQAAPGQSYIYSSANFHLVNCLLERALGSSLYEFAARKLFSPIGIQDIFWECDPQGIPFGGSDLYLKSEDMLNIGKLCYQHGNWEGQQVVPQHWLQIATQPIIQVNELDQYGYGWWVDHNLKEGCLYSFSACGVGGQRIIIIPEKDTIVVTISLTRLHAHSSGIDDAVCAYFSEPERKNNASHH